MSQFDLIMHFCEAFPKQMTLADAIPFIDSIKRMSEVGCSDDVIRDLIKSAGEALRRKYENI